MRACRARLKAQRQADAWELARLRREVAARLDGIEVDDEDDEPDMGTEL
jgi:hypothetical protein